jgi:hypothetical protein
VKAGMPDYSWQNIPITQTPAKLIPLKKVFLSIYLSQVQATTMHIKV